MLKAMDLPLPKTIFAHGWWLTGKTKMSKSLGNVVNPMDMIERCGVDAFRYYLMAEMSPGNDASFTEESFINRYNTDLANDLGNLASRVLKMALRNCNGTIPAPHEMLAEDNELLAAADKALEVMEKSLNTLALDAGISAVMDVVRLGNKYFEAAAPWTLAKTGNIERLETVVYTAAEAMRRVAVLLDPVMPNKMKELRDMLGMNPELPATLESLHDKKNILSGSTVLDRGGLFMRIQVEEPAAACQKPAKEKKEAKAANVVAAEELVEITDFAKIKLKTAKVLTAERVEGADKLLKLSIEVGNETRPLVAGVAQYYTPEEMVGKTIVIVANLKPAVIRGVESAGMLLAAKSGKKLSLVTVEGDIPSGANIG